MLKVRIAGFCSRIPLNPPPRIESVLDQSIRMQKPDLLNPVRT